MDVHGALGAALHHCLPPLPLVGLKLAERRRGCACFAALETPLPPS